nr:hypothetical protein [Sulfobacillus harzensis]
MVRISGEKLVGGEIPIMGYKHAAVQLIAAATILREPVRLTNVPGVTDVYILSEIVKTAGGICSFKNGSLYIDSRPMRGTRIPSELSQKIHGALYLIPAFLKTSGKVEFREFGGCQIGDSVDQGARPIHHVLSVVERFGGRFYVSDDGVVGICSEFKPCTIDVLSYSGDGNGPLVSGVTKTAILCAISCDHGESRILHPYLKLDVLELLDFIAERGFEVRRSAEEIRISKRNVGSGRWSSNFPHRIAPDVSEIMTFITLGVHTHTPVILTNVDYRAMAGLHAELSLLEAMEVPVEWTATGVHVWPRQVVQSQNIVVTSTGIYSDHHPFFALMLTHGRGTSTIQELVWRDRFAYLPGLNLMGADIRRDGPTITIHPSRLDRGGQTVFASDVRAAAVLLIGSLTTPGTTTVTGIHHIDRGYENLFAKLRRLGVTIELLEQGAAP